MLILINRRLKRSKRRFVAALAVMAVIAAVLSAHSAMAGNHMMQDGIGDAIAMCMAVAETAAAVVVAISLAGLRVRPLFRHTGHPGLGSFGPVRPSQAHGRARDGPDLQVFRI